MKVFGKFLEAKKEQHKKPPPKDADLKREE